jgi:hypothetical protein
MNIPKHAAISPTVNALQNTEEGKTDEVTSAFERNLSDLAYNKLTSSFPEIVSSIITFKVLDSDVQMGYGLGVFVLSRDDRMIYVPMVFNNNKAYPMDMCFVKDLDRFLPFNKKWLTEIDTLAEADLGTAEDYAEGVTPDTDLTNIMFPPINKMSSDISDMIKTAVAVDSTWNPRLQLLGFLRNTDELTKTAFRSWLKAHPSTLEFALNTYGVNPLLDSVRPIETMKKTGELTLLTTSSPHTEFKRCFGDKASYYFQKAAQDGVVAKDERENLNTPVKAKSDTQLKEPMHTDVYWVFPDTSDPKKALVVPSPKMIPSPSGVPQARKYLVIFEDKTYLISNRCLSKKADGGTTFIENLFASPDTITNDTDGILVHNRDNELDIRGPFKVNGVKTDTENITRFVGTSEICSPMNIRFNPSTVVDKIVVAKDAKTMYVPPTYAFIKLKKVHDKLEGSPANIFDKMVNKNLAKLSADGRIHSVVRKQHQFSLNRSPAISKTAMTVKLAQDFRMSLSDAFEIIKSASDQGKVTFSMPMTPQLMQQMAAAQGQGGGAMGGPQMDPMMAGGGMPMQQPMGDPAMAAGGGMPMGGAPMGGGIPMGGDPMGGGMPMDPAMAGGMPPGGMPMDPSMMQPPEVNPQMMDAATSLQDPRVFDVAAISTLLRDSTLQSFMEEYLPHLNKALDALARLLLTFRIKQHEIEDKVGLSEFTSFEKDLRSVFTGLGDIILKFNKNVEATK